MYRPNFYESTCFRCNEIVYQVDRVGPLKDFTFFHKDKEVYCSSHVPKIGPGHLDNSSVGIRSALNVPKSNNYYHLVAPTAVFTRPPRATFPATHPTTNMAASTQVHYTSLMPSSRQNCRRHTIAPGRNRSIAIW
ncbi:unnamed protein product [Leptidea sinapis]|uniref:LIM zinc-binding domain-containing protein n=1 Tax=Leptidea sinapis TaxID=189913 RepID=A0A5E4QGS0_9NEOP|nr:unnamed protein product [Leptidea sinapis]